jgi:enoyl-CoA hydratase/carnithine racemase
MNHKNIIDLEFDDHIATVILNRPPVNAINDQWIERMNQILDEVISHGHISVLHIKSALKVFCAGADLDMMNKMLNSTQGQDEMIETIRRLQTVLFRLESISMVSIAEIGGAALGGGLELALACDLRVTADSARLGLPETNLGLLPGAGGTQRLSRICGEAIASRLILGAEIIDGVEALRLGLVQWSVPDEQLTEWTQNFLQHEGALPGHALAAAKSCIAASHIEDINGYERELEETRRLHNLAETQRRVRSFLDKSR